MMTHFARNYSAHYCNNLQGFLIFFLRQAGTNLFTTAALLNYRATLDRATEYKLGCVRTFLKHWDRLGYPGVPAEVIDLLDSWTLRGNPKGRPQSRAWDPVKGPLDDLELQAFNEVAAQEFEKGNITISTLAFALLLSHTGRRPGQLSLIRIGDLFSGKEPDGEKHLVQIPRSKQRGKPPRSETKDFKITADLYRLLQAQANSIVKRVSSQFHPMPTDLIELLPLFPKWDRFPNISDANALALQLQDDSLYETTNAMTQSSMKIKIFSHHAGQLNFHSGSTVSVYARLAGGTRGPRRIRDCRNSRSFRYAERKDLYPRPP